MNNPNHFIEEHLSSTKHEVLQIVWTKEDVEDMEDRTFTDEEWTRIVQRFNQTGFDEVTDYVSYLISEVLK